MIQRLQYVSWYLHLHYPTYHCHSGRQYNPIPSMQTQNQCLIGRPIPWDSKMLFITGKVSTRYLKVLTLIQDSSKVTIAYQITQRLTFYRSLSWLAVMCEIPGPRASGHHKTQRRSRSQSVMYFTHDSKPWLELIIAHPLGTNITIGYKTLHK